MAHTFLSRLEPRTRSTELTPGIAARVYDAAWMLGRQWQLGELLGEDAGSPVGIRMEAAWAPLARVGPAGGAPEFPYDPATLPLEPLVEAEPVRAGSAPWTLRASVDAGRELVQALRAHGAARHVSTYRAAYPLRRGRGNLDEAGARLLDVAAGRLPDGEAAYRVLAPFLRTRRSGLPDVPEIPAADAAAVRAAAEAWLAWCDDTLLEGADPSSWSSERFAYGCSVATGEDASAVVLDATGHRGGALEWHAFDARPPGAGGPALTPLPPLEALPTGVRFRGMPAARWWELEDATIDVGSVDAGAADVARLALLEFTLVYGNDFFVVPLRLPVGSVSRITSLVVADTFGLRLRVGSASRGTGRPGAARWAMFALTERDPAAAAAPAGVADVLFLAPSAGGQVVAGEPFEEVLLLRDEMANLAWAVEQRYEGPTGKAVERLEETVVQREPAPPPEAGATALEYRLGTTVPPYWFPLVPLRRNGELLLDLQRMRHAPGPPSAPRGRLLDLDGPPLHDEEVPREGVRLLRDHVLARWTDGGSVLWARRRRLVGRGEGSSGLRFDAAEPTGGGE